MDRTPSSLAVPLSQQNDSSNFTQILPKHEKEIKSNFVSGQKTVNSLKRNRNLEQPTFPG